MPVEEETPEPAPEDERFKRRRQEAEEVAALLREAFGDDRSAAILEQKIGALEAAPEDTRPETRRGLAGTLIETPAEAVAPSQYVRTYRALCRLLAPTGLSPEVLLLLAVFTLVLAAFSFPPLAILGATGVLILLAALGVEGLDLLALSGAFLIIWEVTDIIRQWERVGALLKRLFF